MSLDLAPADPAPAKNPRRVRAGLAGAAKRWGEGPPRVVRLDDLTGPQRRVVLALIDAARALSVPAGQG
jgi:hypothetical protein